MKNDSSEKEVETTECSIKTDDGVATLPVCLQDILVNSLSFLRTAMWFENGRWRQWEALDCANLDPVHIDFHRIIPYMIFYPGQCIYSRGGGTLTECGRIRKIIPFH